MRTLAFLLILGFVSVVYAQPRPVLIVSVRVQAEPPTLSPEGFSDGLSSWGPESVAAVISQLTTHQYFDDRARTGTSVRFRVADATDTPDITLTLTARGADVAAIGGTTTQGARILSAALSVGSYTRVLTPWATDGAASNVRGWKAGAELVAAQVGEWALANEQMLRKRR